MVGFSKPEFRSLLPYLGDMRSSHCRSKENALGMFLMKLRHNTTQEVFIIFINGLIFNYSVYQLVIFSWFYNLKNLAYENISQSINISIWITSTTWLMKIFLNLLTFYMNNFYNLAHENISQSVNIHVCITSTTWLMKIFLNLLTFLYE